MPGITQSPTSSATPIISAELARSIGCDCAQEWLDRGANPLFPASSAAWRARSLADLVRDTATQDDFLPVMAAWERGFDETLNVATVASVATGLQSDAAAHVRELSFAIETAALEAKILLDAVTGKLAEVSEHADAKEVDKFNAIHCFTKCAVHCLADILAKNEEVIGAAHQMQGPNNIARNLAAQVGGAA